MYSPGKLWSNFGIKSPQYKQSVFRRHTYICYAEKETCKGDYIFSIRVVFWLRAALTWQLYSFTAPDKKSYIVLIIERQLRNKNHELVEDERIKRILPYMFYGILDIIYDAMKYIRYKWIVDNSDQLRLENVYTSLEV